MTDFMERARAEAERERHALYDDEADPFYGFSNQSDAQDYGFVNGARWARDVLLADPTDGEVEAVRLAVHQSLAPDWMHIMHVLGGNQDRYESLLDDIARAAIAAFLAERRGSE